ncbi:MAG: cryptochrome/photolyase family protein, partial [Planctomycetota bacterium]|nr:cryptochrome/photolyase family protein [Planctomycetota bacterium]
MADASKVAWMVYPHQLFDPKHLGSVPGPLFLIEDGLFFGDHVQGWTPHKQKLWLHRSSMKRYAQELALICKQIEYRDHLPGQDMTALVLEDIAKLGHQAVACFEPHDYLLK